MTREELKEHCKRQVQRFERVEKLMAVTPNDWKRYEEHKLILELLEQEPCEDCISRQGVLQLLANSIGKTNTYLQTAVLKMPSVTPQEPQCKECKWWKDSDGEYRRGCGAESQCPINRREVFEGNGYCYLYEPQESEDKE